MFSRKMASNDSAVLQFCYFCKTHAAYALASLMLLAVCNKFASLTGIDFDNYGDGK